MTEKKPQSILITGASSGLGAALALYYAAPGAHLALSGRHAGRLEDVLTACRAQGAEAVGQVVDVTDQAAMAAWILAVDDARPLDLVIANAGISGGTGIGPLGKSRRGELPEQAREIFAINLTGVLNTLDPILPRMLDRGAGQVAIMSSLASFCGWPGAPSYSASKGAVRLYGEALRGALAPAGVRVNVLCPGFIRTPMTAVNNYPMPFMMDADRAARIMADGLARNRPRIAFPWPTYMLAGFMGLLPPGLATRLLSRLPAKPSH